MTIENFTNPFSTENSELFNLVTMVPVRKDIKTDLLAQSDIGQKLFQSFVGNRIKSDKVNVWSPMKKQKLKTWKTISKKVKVAVGKETIELREDRSLFASC